MDIKEILTKTWSRNSEEWLEKWYNTQLIFFVFQKGNNPVSSIFNKDGLNVIALNQRWYYEEPYSTQWDKDKKKAAEEGAKILLLLCEKEEECLTQAKKIIEKVKDEKKVTTQLLKEIREGLLCLWFIFLSDIGEYLTAVIDKRLQTYGFSLEESQNIKDYFLSQDYVFMYEKEQREFQTIVKEYQQRYDGEVTIGFNTLDPKLYQKLITHWEKYRFLPYTELDTQPYSVEDLFNKIKDYTLFKTFDKKQRNIDGVLEKKLSEEDRSFLKAVKQYIFLDNHTDEVYIQLEGILAELVHETHNISYKDLTWYTFDELEALVEKGLPITKETIAERKNYRVMFYGDHAFETWYGERPYKLLHTAFYKQPDQVQEFVGQIASRGYAKGVVKIVKGIHDMNKIKVGDILVSPSTRPELVIAMQKCAAIVTDHGGITSHAAIISREFGIPCIVGTDNATQVLQDGDMVEVDANEGIVRKI
jgi:phosphohistidine swiveling domain-containing protein